MSSYNLSSQTGTSYVTGTGIGSINIPSSSILTSPSTSYGDVKISIAKQPDNNVCMVVSAHNGEPRIYFTELIGADRIKAILEPDSSMSSSELMKITALITAMREPMVAAQLLPITYLRKHNLERHFRFEQA